MLNHIRPGEHIFRFMDHRSEFFWPTIIDLLAERKLFLNSRTRFNDRFDSRPLIEEDLDVANAQLYLNEMIANPSSVVEPDQASQLLKASAGIAPVLTPRHISGISQRLRLDADEFNDRCGLVSFSLALESRLVWAHYAAGFSGVCVDFCRREVPQSVLALCSRVVYVDQPPRLPLSLIHRLVTDQARGKSVDTICDQICLLSFLHKARDWDYEREARICYPLGSNTKCSFAPDELVGLIVGPKASTDLEQQLRTGLQHLPHQLRSHGLPFPRPISELSFLRDAFQPVGVKAKCTDETLGPISRTGSSFLRLSHQ